MTPPALSEAQFQSRVTDYCDWLKLQWHHEVDSRRSKSGFPDLCIVGPGGMVFWELKAQKGRVSPEQQTWIDALINAGQVAAIMRPSDWPVMEKELLRLAGR